MILCQTCRHHPGRGSLCAVGHRHATAAAKLCPHHQRGPSGLRVALQRHAAVELLRDGHQREYQRALQAAHREAEQ